MADKIFFKTGSASSLPTTKTAGQLLFAIDGTTGSIYLDKDSDTRIKFNADAVKLATPRSINGTSFDGSSDITTANWGTARNISISDATGANTGAAVSVNGSQAVTLKLPATLVATLKGNADTATKATSADKATVSESCTGNAATASKLKTGVSINGSTFDGSAGITTSKWGTARIITVSDNTGDHTQANSGIDGSANFTIKLPATITATLVGNASSATYATNAGTADTAKACTGNAATATKLKTGVSINGTTFDGSGAITTGKWGTARTVTISDYTGANTQANNGIDGSNNFTLKLPATLAASITGNAATATKATSADSATTATTCTGNAATATKLKAGVAINGTTFDGSSAITTTKWGTSRTVTISDNDGINTQANSGIDGSNNFTLKLPATIKANLSGKATSAGTADSATTATTAATCTGNAATATKLQTIRSINGTNFDGSADITTVKWGTARDVTIGDTKKSVNGNTNYAWTHDEIGWRRSWSTTITCATWSRLCYVAAATNVIGSKFLLNIGSTRNNVVYNDLFVITTHHSSKASIVKLSGSQYSTGYQIRVLSNSNGDCYVELYDALHDATSATTTTVNCRLIPIYTGALTKYTSFTSGATLPTNFSVSKTLTISNTSDLQGNLEGKATEAGLADKASKLATARSITLAGDVTGTTSFDGSSNVSLTATVGNDTHNHSYSTISLKGSYVSNTSYTSLPDGITYIEMPSTATVTGDPAYGAMLTVKYGGGRAFQVVGNSSNKFYFRGMHSGLSSDAGTGYGPWRAVALSDGGTYTMNITGNASGTASKLATPRNITISGTASSSVGTFDGGANTTIYMPLTIQGFNEIKTKKLTITGTEQVSHIAFSRGAWNYFTAPTSGGFAFVPNGGTTTNGAGATFVITGTTVQPGEKNNTIDLGTSTYRWKNVYATTFTGALSGNATTATTLATPRNLTISDTASSSVASFNGGSNTTLYMPLTIKGFTSIESDKFVVNNKVTLQYNTTNECLEFVFA